MDTVYTALKAFGKVRTNEPLSKHTTFKIGGPARYLVIVDHIERLTALLAYLQEEGIEYFFLGGGSNMLAADEGFDGVVVKVVAKSYEVDGSRIIADAGCATVEIAQVSMQHKLTGFEWGVGVPGSIGGAVRGNAGAMGRDMSESVGSLCVFRDGEVVTMSKSECAFHYRDSVFKHTTDIVLRVTLQLAPADEGAGGMKEALQHLQYRNTTQPQGWASTGCIFKNYELSHGMPINIALPEQFLETGRVSAGFLVDKAGLKGARVGQAQVSEKHGNFIVNLGSAKAADVKALIDQIKTTVHEMFGVSLEEEIYCM